MRQLRIAMVIGVMLLCGIVLLTAGRSLFATQTQPKAEENSSEALARTIRHQIQVLPFYSVFDNIEFHLDDNRVTLTGQVLRPTLKTHAESAVKNLEGVSLVVNQIEVLPASSADDELRRAIYRALFEDQILKRYAIQAVPPIHIIVKDGNVVLEGQVESDSDRKLAGTRAGETPDSKSFQNHLRVKGK